MRILNKTIDYLLVFPPFFKSYVVQIQGMCLMQKVEYRNIFFFDDDCMILIEL